MTTAIRIEYVTIGEIEHRHNGHWFSAGAMRFFKSRLPQGGYRKGDKAYFISSEKNDREPRYYTIRVIDWQTGDVDFSDTQLDTMTRRILDDADITDDFWPSVDAITVALATV